MSAGIAPIEKRPAWKALGDHYPQVRELHLRQLFTADPNRGAWLKGDKMSRPLEAGRIRRCQRDSYPLGVS